MLSQELSHPTFTVLTDCPERTKRSFPFVQAQNRSDLLAVAKVMREADIVLWGGGHLIQNISSQSFMLFQLALVNLALAQGVPVMAFALGAGDLQGSVWRRLTTATLNRLSAITVRDVTSREFLQRMAVERPITVSADPAIVLRYDQSRPPQLQEKTDAPYAVIAPRRWFHYHHAFFPVKWQPALSRVASPHFDTIIDGLAHTADWLVGTYGINIVLLPMYPGVEQGDELVCQAIRNRMANSSRAQITRINYEAGSLLSIIGSAMVVLGVRLHSTILATCAGVPSVHLHYQQKGLGFFTQIGLSEFCMAIDAVDWALLEARLQQLIDQRQFYHEHLIEKRDELTLAARESAGIVRRILAG